MEIDYEGLIGGSDESEFNGKILIVDFSNLAVRNAFCIVSSKPMDHGVWIDWYDMTLSGILGLITKFKADRVVIAQDCRGTSWRKDKFPEYKANRDKTKLDFDSLEKAMDNMCNELQENLPFYCVRVDKCEGDDVIASIAKYHGGKSEIIIASSDRDFNQLLQYPNVKRYDLIQHCFAEVMNPKADIEIKIITGDKNDNIPPIKRGYGPKTASKLYLDGVNFLESDDKELSENFLRNKLLIDFDFIPSSINDSVIKAYKDIKITKKKTNDIWSYVASKSPDSGLAKFQQNTKSIMNLK